VLKTAGHSLSVSCRTDPASRDDEHGYDRYMDGHTLLGHLAICSDLIGDGGPRGYRRRGSRLPEKYLPGRFLAGLAPDVHAEIVHAVNDLSPPAPWFLRQVVAEEESRAVLPPPPVERSWGRHGRWSR
jgi:hypothetical protein